MARGINKVIIVGNLGDKPDVRRTPNGNTIANLSVATSESWRDRQTNQMVEKTEWHRVVIFGKLAEIAETYLHKGSKVYLEGKLQTRKWQDKQGQDRYTTEIVIDINGTLQMLDRKEDYNNEKNMTLEDTKQLDSSYQVKPKATNNVQTETTVNLQEDDIPF